MTLAVAYRIHLSLLFVLLTLILPTPTQCVEDACQLARLNRVFKANYSSDAVYQCSFCFFNAGELARQARQTLGNDFEEEALNILVVKQKSLPDPTIEPEELRLSQLIVGLNPRNPRKDKQGRNYALWKYHAVLEYHGKILDLDRKGPRQAIPAIEYFEEMFNFVTSSIAYPTSHHADDHVAKPRDYNLWGGMHVFLIPVSEYFRRFPDRPHHPPNEHLSFVWESPSIEVWDYLQKKYQKKS